MIRCTTRPLLAATRMWATFGDNADETAVTPGVNASQANLWLPRAIDLYTINHVRQTATGSGNSFDIEIYDGTTAVHTFTHDNTDGTDQTENFTATLTAASDATPGQATLLREVLTGSANAEGRTAFVYQDQSTDGLSFHAAGDGAQNLGVGASTEYIGVGSGGSVGSTVEIGAQTVWPSAGTLSNFVISYRTDADTTYDVQLRLDGSNARQITGASLPAATSQTLTAVDTTSVAVTQDQLIAFSITRASGTGTLFVCAICFTFTE